MGLIRPALHRLLCTTSRRQKTAVMLMECGPAFCCDKLGHGHKMEGTSMDSGGGAHCVPTRETTPSAFE